MLLIAEQMLQIPNQTLLIEKQTLLIATLLQILLIARKRS